MQNRNNCCASADAVTAALAPQKGQPTALPMAICHTCLIRSHFTLCICRNQCNKHWLSIPLTIISQASAVEATQGHGNEVMSVSRLPGKGCWRCEGACSGCMSVKAKSRGYPRALAAFSTVSLPFLEKTPSCKSKAQPETHALCEWDLQPYKAAGKHHSHYVTCCSGMKAAGEQAQDTPKYAFTLQAPHCL